MRSISRFPGFVPDPRYLLEKFTVIVVIVLGLSYASIVRGCRSRAHRLKETIFDEMTVMYFNEIVQPVTDPSSLQSP